MKKVRACIGLVCLITLLAGVYGIIHDQVTYTISPEYFTKFKYEQFGFEPNWFGGHRPTVAIIGFLATWWFGLLIGVIFGILGLIFVERARLVAVTLQAVRSAFLLTMLAGVVGFFYGRMYLAQAGVSWWLPENLTDKAAFITVGSIHNFGYVGGLLGLLTGILQILGNRKGRLPQQLPTTA
ncbi:hypothetical protein [Hymenobacter sediminicola]|uniref:Signal peptide-containing protein n=1 Tax=Hymenobacter sediminicola TaxID=2761579 RepID=A0A7G7WC19_9BACT|nr:hypothetical protein [Hymenobacter sediminicola]QNH63912.1 hypothetical protein H4317_09015 [Hymenobacter sediminicola]